MIFCLIIFWKVLKHVCWTLVRKVRRCCGQRPHTRSLPMLPTIPWSLFNHPLSDECEFVECNFAMPQRQMHVTCRKRLPTASEKTQLAYWLDLPEESFHYEAIS